MVSIPSTVVFEEIDCTVIGDALWDIIIKASSHTLVKNSVSLCSYISLHSGGSANVATGISALGGSSVFVGKIGGDLLGDLYVADLEAYKVNRVLFKAKNERTGVAITLVEESGERSFLVYRGANDLLSPREVKSVSNVIEKSNFLYVSGYSLDNPPQRDAVLKAVDIALKSNVKIVFDPAAYTLTKKLKPIFLDLTKKCYIFCPNLDEAKSLIDKGNTTNIIKTFKDRVPVLVLKLGARGSIITTEDQIIRIPPFKVKCVDTTGAGDAFISALIYGLCRNYPLKKAGLLANRFASRVVTSYGARSYPSKAEIQKFLCMRT